MEREGFSNDLILATQEDVRNIMGSDLDEVTAYRKHPKVILRNGDKIQLEFPSEKSARKYFNKMKKKNPKIG